MSEINTLFGLIDKLQYPETMYKIKGEIQSTAFFPGGKGTYDNSDTISDKRIMVLGQDFDSKENFDKLKEKGRTNLDKNSTWRNLLAFLDELNIPPDSCFFTNAILGARNGSVATGKSPAFKDPIFITHCQEIFLRQIEIQKPEVILVLGKQVAEFLSPLALELVSWKKIKNFKSIDEQNDQCKRNLLFSNNIMTNAVLLTHPSFRNSNVHRRSFDTFEGNKAELEMVKDILK